MFALCSCKDLCLGTDGTRMCREAFGTVLDQKNAAVRNGEGVLSLEFQRVGQTPLIGIPPVVPVCAEGKHQDPHNGDFDDDFLVSDVLGG